MFDPYRDWLGVTDDRRPPTLYQLLGISPSEPNLQVIEGAVTRQLAKIQEFLTGPQSKEAWRLVDEITLAKTTLLDPARRASYDAIFGFGPKPAATTTQGPPPVSIPENTSPWFAQSTPAPTSSPASVPWYVADKASSAPVVPNSAQAPWYLGQQAPEPAAPPMPPAPIPQRPAAKPAPAAPQMKPVTPPKRPPISIPPSAKSKPAPDFDSNEDFDDHDTPSSDGFPSATAIAKPRVKRGGVPVFALVTGGLVAAGIVGAAVYFATLKKPDNNKKQTEVVENSEPKHHPVVNHPHDDSNKKVTVVKEKDPDVTVTPVPKKKPPEKKKNTTPPKNDPPPPNEVADEFKQARIYRGHETPPKSMAIRADGKQILSTGDDLSVFSWSPTSDRPSRRMSLMSPPAVGVGFLPGGKEAVALDGGFIYVFKLADNSLQKKIVTPAGGFQGFAIGTDATHILTCSNDGKLRWWDITKDDPIKTISVTESPLDCVSLSADGKLAVTGARDGTLSLWEIPSGQMKKKWAAVHKGGVSGVAFAADGKHFASVGEDKQGKVWNVELNTPLFGLAGHPSAPTGVGFSADGSLIATTGDTSIRLFNATTGSLLRTHKGEAKAMSVSFDPKDRFLVAGLADGGMQMLMLPSVRPDNLPRSAQVQPPKQRLRSPAANAVESAVSEVRNKYKKDLALTAEDDQLALFDKLLTQASVGPHPEAERYALFEEARDLAGKMGRIDLALKVVTARSTWFDADELADKAAALQATAKAGVTKAVTEAALSVVEDAERQARPDIVDELMSQREMFRQLTDAAALNERIQASEKRWIASAKEREASRQLIDDVKKDASNPALNAQAGRHLCFRVGEWTDGLPMLIKGDDAAIKEMAKSDLASPKDTKGQIELARSWFAYAGKAEAIFKPGILMRSRFWYEKAMAGDLLPSEKLAVGARISEINKQIAANPATLSRPGEPAIRHSFNTVRSRIAVDTQWVLAGSDGFKEEGVTLKADAGLTSRFRVLSGCRVEFTFVPDGREVKVQLGNAEATFKPMGTSAMSLVAERKGNEVKLSLIAFTGVFDTDKTATLTPGSADPMIVLSVPGAAPKDGLLMKSVVVNGPVRPTE